MKSYKVKSLIYLSCFILAAVLYNRYEENTFQNQFISSETVDTTFEDDIELENDKVEEEDVEMQ
ncbi:MULTISPECIES: hypothetical protein [Croceitalea]|uniref:Secreted protein n=1 Tax=Croceitalea vernalis TaxID=3075599 RepID=A0ABU3BK15_9FLAO|nr:MULTISPECIES: hypothetical protein [unclassified Croceitalea]MDT0540648.1 hypothetical protein [Croceitalea sp. P059]MDT0622504.1 hypothetical protein [Croceitalea sp. P007]